MRLALNETESGRSFSNNDVSRSINGSSLPETRISNRQSQMLLPDEANNNNGALSIDRHHYKLEEELIYRMPNEQNKTENHHDILHPIPRRPINQTTADHVTTAGLSNHPHYDGLLTFLQQNSSSTVGKEDGTTATTNMELKPFAGNNELQSVGGGDLNGGGGIRRQYEPYLATRRTSAPACLSYTNNNHRSAAEGVLASYENLLKLEQIKMVIFVV